MNRELFTLGQHERVDDALKYLVALGITGAPVLDDDDTLIGFASWRDLLRAQASDRLLSSMSVPVDTIGVEASIADAAEQLCEHNRHHLVCVDARGRPVGFIGSLDVLRGLTGRPVPHPESFPHWDEATGLRWSNEMRLDETAVRALQPKEAGIYVLVHPAAGASNHVVWSEAVIDVRDRLLRMLEVGGEAPPHLARLIERGELWFRYAVAPSVRALSAVAHSGG